MRPDRGRLAIGVAAVALIAGAITADRISPAQSVSSRPVAPLAPGGLLACPVLYQGNGSGSLHVANVGAEASKVIVTTVREGAGSLFRSFTLAAGKVTTMGLDPTVRQKAGAIVQFSGGEIVASTIATFRDGPGSSGGVASSCRRAGDRTIVVPSGSTLKAETRIVLLNPSTSDAAAEISLLVDGEELTPEGLKGFEVRSRSRREFRVGDFAFDARNVATVIRVRTGVMVAAGIVASERGVSITPGGPLLRTAAGVAVTAAGSGLLDVVALGDQDTVADASEMTAEGLTAFAALSEAIEPLRPQSTSLGDEKLVATGVVLSVRDGSPIASALRWVVQIPDGRGDIAGSEMREPARRVVAVSGAPAVAAQSRVLIGNPSDRDVAVTLRVVTDQGIGPSRPAVTVQAGRAVSLPVGDVKGPFAVIAESPVGIAMAISSTVVGSTVSSFTVTGLPMPDSVAVPVERDPRTGVPG